MYDQIYITGFKKFDTILINPTQLLIDHLTQNPIKNITATKLDVTISQVDQYIQKTKHFQQNNPTKKLLNIHCGVGPNKQYFLQHCAYNNKDFRIPDNEGNIYKNQQICFSQPLDQPNYTKIDLQYLISKLKQKHQVIISKDPGRFLCNYVYYCSLKQLKCQNQNVDCLFVHFPILDVKNQEQNKKFLFDLIQLLLVKKKQEQKEEDKLVKQI